MATPPATPKPTALVAVYDIDFGVSRCIARLDMDEATGYLEASAQCHAQVAFDFDLAEPPVGFPLPYTLSAPIKLSGSSLDALWGCLPNFGGPEGPNVVVRYNVTTLSVWTKQSIAACNAPSLSSVIGTPLELPVANIAAIDEDSDTDGDGCTDADELWAHKPGGAANCGDDPWNPNDSLSADPATADARFNGIYYWQITAIRADAAGGVPIVGAYFHCIADMQKDPAPALNFTARPFCYIDNPAVPVNSKSNTIAGDGLPGSPPPRGNPLPPGTTNAKETGANCYPIENPAIDNDSDGLIDDGCPWALADVDNVQTVLNGKIDTNKNLLIFEGCFNDQDGNYALGDVYVKAAVGRFTGTGTIDIWAGQPDNCAGSPVGPVTFGGALLEIARQPDDGKANDPNDTGARDTDSDGCSDSEELENTAQRGGFRDPYNRWDFYDVDGPGAGPPDPDKAIDLPNDVLGVILRYTPSVGQAGYVQSFDRGSGLPGSNAWNKRQPDGTIDLPNDILGVILQYQHNCTAA